MLEIKEDIGNGFTYTFSLNFPACCFMLSKLSFVFAMWGITVGLFVLAADLFIMVVLYYVLKHLVIKKMNERI